MKRRGLIIFCVIFFCASFLIINNVLAVEGVKNFLSLPLSQGVRVLQGWVYTLLVNGNTKHEGIDYDCNVGDKIYAAHDGIAMASEQKGVGYGKFVFIKHADGFATLYGHLDRSSEKIIFFSSEERANTKYDEWTPIKKGEYVGDCGMSGTNNDHLHFEVTRGGYSVGRLDPYDLYMTKQFYPPNSSFTGMGENHLWITDPPTFDGKILVTDSTEQESAKKEISPTIKTTADSVEFVEKVISVYAEPGSDIRVTIQVKNTRKTVLKKGEVSLNVVGGKEKNALFRHPSWITDLRPALLNDLEVPPNGVGTFVFNINPLSVGTYSIEFMVVRIGDWVQINNENVRLNVQVSEKKIEEVSVEQRTKEKVGILGGVVRGVKEFTETIIDTVVDVFKAVPEFFGGGTKRTQIIHEPEEIIASEVVTSTDYEVDEGFVSTAITTTIPIDTTPPNTPALEMVQRGVTTTLLEWVVPSTESEELWYSLEERRDDEGWSEIFFDNTSTAYEWSGELFHVYALRIRARDQFGNTSQWSDEIVFTTGWNNKVVFNEVAWAGASSVCASKQWVELYNTTDTSISLHGWVIEMYATDGSVQKVPLTQTIRGNDYYLISHAGVFPSTFTYDQVLSGSVKIPIIAGRLVLKDGEGAIQDEISQETGWHGGEQGEYPSTLERTSAEQPSFVHTNWRSSDSVRYGMRTGNCGYLTGSPRMDNTGYAYISDEVKGFYAVNDVGELVLSQEKGPYLWSSLTVKFGEKLKILPGVVMIGVDSGSRMVVEGELRVEGLENDKVVFTSRNDADFVRSVSTLGSLLLTTSSKAGDWQNIEVHGTGKVVLRNSALRYGGNRYNSKIGCGGGCYRSQVISNFGGVIELENTEIEFGYENGSQSIVPDSFIYSNTGLVFLTNVRMRNGSRALHTTMDARVVGRGVAVDDFVQTESVFYFDKTMPEEWNDISSENGTVFAFNPTFTVTSSYTLTSRDKFIFDKVLVNSGAELVVENGDLYAYSIRVAGRLFMRGGANRNEIAGGPSPGSSFSYLLFEQGSTGTISNTIMRGGGYFQNINAYPVSSNRPYMLWIEGGVVDISNSVLSDARRPGGVVRVNNGSAFVQDSMIGWTGSYEKTYHNDSWYEHGITMLGNSSVRVENTVFKNLDYIVHNSHNLGTFSYDRMNLDHVSEMYGMMSWAGWTLPRNLIMWE